MQNTETEITAGATSGGAKTPTGKMPTSAALTKPSVSKGSPTSTKTGTAETLPALSEELPNSLETAGLDSMKLLQKSANKLMALLDAAVPDNDLDRGKDGGMKVEAHRLETAVSIANAIATTVQTQVNMVKAMAGIMGGK